MKILRRMVYALGSVLLVALLMFAILFFMGFRFTAESAVHSFFRDKTHIGAGEYDFWLNDVVDESGMPVYGSGHQAVKKIGFLYRMVDNKDKKVLLDGYGDYVGNLTRYEGEEGVYYFVHWVSAVTGIEDEKYTTSMRYFTDSIKVNGEEILLDYHCFFTFDGEIEHLEILGEEISLADEYKKPDVSLFAPRPENTSLEFWITEDVQGVDFSNHQEIVGWMGAREFYGLGYYPEKSENGYDVKPRHYVTYLISAYPDYADGGMYVTEIEITDPQVSVYELTVNSPIEDFETVFRRMGYLIEVKDINGRRTFSAKKYNEICFYFDEGDESVTPKLRIRAMVSNRDGIEF